MQCSKFVTSAIPSDVYSSFGNVSRKTNFLKYK
ncbi:hypothetical protein Bhyg_00726 [Pseudolycoriella hygida]|uniref:Uncharacterized protein n=1 Tax=Pseudolycoriella hygida TaxID=35572 RepID=A0A9Q0S6U9_9DIPT|nr:hypothetical protein Bhyg_00726 [Pseudolycoriella hygida]